MWESVFRSGVLIQRLTDCDWSIHFWRRAAASMTHLWSMSNAVRYLCFRSAGIRSMSFNSPSKYFKLSIMSRSQRPRALRSLTRNGFRTMNSPDRFDLTKSFLSVGSMQGDVFVMFEIVAVGAIASTLLLRMPWAAIFMRSGDRTDQDPIAGHRADCPCNLNRRSRHRSLPDTDRDGFAGIPLLLEVLDLQAE